MQKSKPTILLISSANPTIGPGIMSLNSYSAFKKAGYDIDLLTLYKCKSNPEFLYIYDNTTLLFKIVKIWLKLKTKIIALFFSLKDRVSIEPKDGYNFFYRDEENPPIPIKLVLSKINRKYDLVFINFWQGMLSFKTVDAIYEKLHCQFRFAFVDYSPMSGGCHFTNGCEKYQTGCGECPAFNSHNPKDFTYRNVLYRAKVYDKIQPVITGNSYMFSFYEKSYLLKDVKKWSKAFPIIDLSVFHPHDIKHCRYEYSIDNDAFVLLIGSQQLDNERKGVKYLISALDLFYNSLTFEEKKQVLVVAIGENFDKIENKIKFKTKGLGFVNVQELPKIYSMADLFLCSSINDAGPMMVNQSLCCGTPVVGFEMGACLDAVKGNGTGYCVPVKDVQAFAKSLQAYFYLPCAEKETIRQNCINYSQTIYSDEAFVKRVINSYNTSFVVH